MTPAGASGWRPLIVAFAIWFAHFLVCWAAAELLWPRQWLANGVAWGATTVALGLLVVHWRRLDDRRPSGQVVGWTRRLGQGATAIAGAAVVFSTVPSLIFLPWR